MLLPMKTVPVQKKCTAWDQGGHCNRPVNSFGARRMIWVCRGMSNFLRVGCWLGITRKLGGLQVICGKTRRRRGKGGSCLLPEKCQPRMPASPQAAASECLMQDLRLASCPSRFPPRLSVSCEDEKSHISLERAKQKRTTRTVTVMLSRCTASSMPSLSL